MFTSLQEFSPFLTHGGIALLLVGEILLSCFVVFLWLQNRNMKRKMAVFFSGKEAKDLEKILLDQLHETEELDHEIQELFEISNRLRELGLKSIHKMSVLRFNPFKEVGGNQSFSVALLDGKNSGVILSSLHTREGTRVYAKPVVSGKPDGFPFTEEEKEAIVQAISGKPSVSL